MGYKVVEPLEIYNDVPPNGETLLQTFDVRRVAAACFTVKQDSPTTTAAQVEIQGSLNGEDWDDLQGTVTTINASNPFVLFDLGGTGAGLSFAYVRFRFSFVTNTGDNFVVLYGAKG